MLKKIFVSLFFVFLMSAGLQATQLSKVCYHIPRSKNKNMISGVILGCSFGSSIAVLVDMIQKEKLRNYINARVIELKENVVLLQDLSNTEEVGKKALSYKKDLEIIKEMILALHDQYLCKGLLEPVDSVEKHPIFAQQIKSIDLNLMTILKDLPESFKQQNNAQATIKKNSFCSKPLKQAMIGFAVGALAGALVGRYAVKETTLQDIEKYKEDAFHIFEEQLKKRDGLLLAYGSLTDKQKTGLKKSYCVDLTEISYFIYRLEVEELFKAIKNGLTLAESLGKNPLHKKALELRDSAFDALKKIKNYKN